MAKKTFEIDADLVRGVALLFDIAVEDVESVDIECALLKELKHARDNCHAKAEALQEVIRTQYVPYNPEEEKHEAE